MPQSPYRPVDQNVAFPEVEKRIQDFWDAHGIFKKSLAQREGAPEWVFYEGPPTANNKPGLHHTEARIFKDIFCRFQSMRGHYVHRKAGWDCHGLPVEIEVEKELGITAKRQIEEEIGIENFVRRCRESVQRYVDDWKPFTDRLGFWIDLDNAYWTMDRDYIETVWWILKQIWDKGLLEEDFKVVPYCPRCETSLSNHEQHQTGAYQTVEDPSIYVRFPLIDTPEVSLLIWTTTPWTLLANMAVAVGRDVDYVKVADPRRAGHFLIVARERVEPLIGEGAEILEELSGGDLLDRRYSPPFDFVSSGDSGHRVRPADFVTTEDGSGIVHLAPYGEDDMTVARRDNLPVVQMIDGSGRVVAEGGDFAGLWIKDADPRIVDDLAQRELLYSSEIYQHSYPHCWRCGTPLLYYARKDWYVRTSQIRNDLMASNEATNWQPPTIKYGRFGDWLANNVDWSLSRDRYWGTPLPIWRCPEGHDTCVGSFQELSELAGRDVSGIEPHRPFIDDVTIECPQCGAAARRVTFVIDTWFDAGSMPFGQWHYPFENEDVFRSRFPADFISEAIDQTRGWFYTLLAVATLIEGQNSFRNVVCLGLLVDAEGRKMSKSLGNVIDPWTVFEEVGADALRWYMLTAGTPWTDRRISLEIIQESLRKFLLTLWNTYSFWVLYASIENFDPTGVDIPVSERTELDRWILAELDDTVRVVTESLSSFDATSGGRRLDAFVDDLSNWYVRRSRRRFWRSKEEADTRSAFLTLWECLESVARLIAPFTPFVADEIYTNLTVTDASAPESVHLSEWPAIDGTRSDDELRARMAIVRRLVVLGRAARTDAKVRVRQPLRRALLVVPSEDAARIGELGPVIADELNVKSVEMAEGVEELISYTVKPNFRTLGPRFGGRVKEVAAALARADAHALVQQVESTGSATIELDGEAVSVDRTELDVRVEGKGGLSLAQDGPYGVALDLEIDPELLAEGVARETVRGIQDLRKSAGLAVEDRIELWLSASEPSQRDALGKYRGFVAGEVLATSVTIDGDAPEDVAHAAIEVEGTPVRIALRRAAR